MTSSITDWIQAGAAILASILLFVTLRLQSKATKFQATATGLQAQATQDQIALNSKQHKVIAHDLLMREVEVRPTIKILVVYQKWSQFFELQLSIVKNTAYFLCIDFENKDFLNPAQADDLRRANISLLEGITESTHIDVDPIKIRAIYDAESSIPQTIILYYADLFGNQYRQEFWTDLNNFKIIPRIPLKV